MSAPEGSAWPGKPLGLEKLMMPTGIDASMSVFIDQPSARAATIAVRISGVLPEGELRVALPGKLENFRCQCQVEASFP